MADGVYTDSLPAAVRAGRLDQALVDSAVHRILRLKYIFGLFDDPYRFTNVEQEKRYTLAPEHLMASRIAGREAVVLLKNDSSTLPLRKDLRTIAVIGPLADDSRSALGPWSADGRPAETVNALQGIRNAVAQGTRVLYVRGGPVDSADTTGFLAARSAATAADAIVLVLGERETMSGEASSRAWIELPGSQLALARAVLNTARASSTGTQKPVVVVLMNGRALAIPELAAEMPAILESWFLGSQHGNALADVLFGDYNPGGKLPTTFPRATGQIPIYYNHRNTGRPADSANYYTSKYVDLHWSPLFPYGFGLSYSKFNYSNLRLSSTRIAASDSLEVSVDVGNLSDRAGDEVVQLYIRDEVASVAEPVRALKGFKRVTIQPGRSVTVAFKLGPDAFALYDQQMRRVVEPGYFSIYVGTNSRDTMASRVEITGDTLVLAPPTPRFH
jgi:beta-glucosidase